MDIVNNLLNSTEGPRQLLFNHLDMAVAFIESYKWVGEISFIVKLNSIDQILIPLASDLGLGLSLLKVCLFLCPFNLF